MSHAVFPGSFDPLTLGHIDIIQRCSKQFDKLTVLVANSTSKKYLFTVDERVALIKEALADNKINVESFSGLTINYVNSSKSNCIVRGLRGVSDFEYEMAMARMNKKLSNEVETMLVFSDPNLNYISSSMAKEIAKLDGDLSNLIPKNIIIALKNKMERKCLT